MPIHTCTCMLIFNLVGLARITCEASIIVCLRMSGDEVHDSSHVYFIVRCTINLCPALYTLYQFVHYFLNRQYSNKLT